MSFISSEGGSIFHAGHFLVDDEQCLRVTATIAANHAQKVTRNGRVIVPAGAVIPANGSTAKGILYEDIDVTEGDAAGSIVTKGTIYGDRLPAALDSDAATALTEIVVVAAAPTVTRPDYFKKEFVGLTVTSTEGATSGKTVISVSGVTLGTGETLQYKADADPLPLGSKATGFTSFDSGDSLTIADGKEVAVIAVTAGGYVFGTGTVTADTKA